jgi:hypothetical protein
LLRHLPRGVAARLRARRPAFLPKIRLAPLRGGNRGDQEALAMSAERSPSPSQGGPRRMGTAPVAGKWPRSSAAAAAPALFKLGQSLQRLFLTRRTVPTGTRRRRGAVPLRYSRDPENGKTGECLVSFCPVFKIVSCPRVFPTSHSNLRI